MNCPNCFRYSESGFYCRRCIHEMMLSMKEEYEIWLKQIEVLPSEENYYS